MGKYRKKPVEIEAFLWTGGPDQTEDPEWAVEAINKGKIFFAKDDINETIICINTLEGVMTGQQGDYIIKGVKGEIYPCKPDIFELTYEPVTEN